MYKLIATDIDGTLIRDDKKISERTKEMIKKWTEKGNFFICVSGRAHTGVLSLVKDLNLKKTYHVAYNGNILFNADGKVKIMTYFDYDEYKVLIDHLRKTSRSYVVMDGKCMNYETEDLSANEIMIPNNGDIEFIKIEDSLKIKNPFQICSYYETKEEAEKILSKKYKTISGCVTNPALIDFFPNVISKANGLSKIVEELGVKKEEVIAIGDNGNDIDMIKYAGMGVAVKNATDDLKNESDEVLDYTNNEDAVYHLIKRYI